MVSGARASQHHNQHTWWHKSSLLSSWSPKTCTSLVSLKLHVPTTNFELVPPPCSSDRSFEANAAIHRAGRLRLYVDDALENMTVKQHNSACTTVACLAKQPVDRRASQGVQGGTLPPTPPLHLHLHLRGEAGTLW